MTTNIQLVRHPAPAVTESLLSYVLKLSQANGYPTPWAIYQLAGMGQNVQRRFALPLDKLAQISGQSLEDLRRISFAVPLGSTRFCQVLGHVLPISEVSFDHPGICPQCVQELGYIEGVYHLRLMTGCPFHRRSLATICSSCGRPLTWFRGGLLTCRCGASLLSIVGKPVSDAVVGLLAIIHARSMGIAITDCSKLGLPGNDLFGLELRELLRVIRVLGKYKLRLDGQHGDCHEIVEAASRVLENWPNNFYELLDQYGKKIGNGPGASVRTRFSGIYTSLFKGRCRSTCDSILFLRKAFLEFATDRWDGYVDPKVLAGVKGVVSQRVTVTQLATRCGVQPRTAKGYVAKLSLSLHAGPPVAHVRPMIDLRTVHIPKTVSGKILRAREAAAQLGISPALLKDLKECGIYEAQHLFPAKPGYHELDVNRFRARLNAISRAIPRDRLSENFIALRAALHNPHDSIALKVSLVKGVLDGKIATFGDISNPHGDLLLDRSSYELVCTRERQNALGGTLSARQTSSMLRCDPECVHTLIQNGWLAGEPTGTGHRVFMTSIEDFRASWRSLAEIAVRISSSSRALARRCEAAGLQTMLVLSRKGAPPQPFISIEALKFFVGKDTYSEILQFQLAPKEGAAI